MSIARVSTASLCCGADAGAIALNTVGFLEEKGFSFNGILLPRSTRGLEGALRALFEVLAGKRSSMNEVSNALSMVYRLNDGVDSVGGDLEFVKAPFGGGCVLDVYLAGTAVRVGSMYLGVENVAPPFIGWAESLRGLRRNKVTNDDSVLVLGMAYCYGNHARRLVLGAVADGVSSLGKGYCASSESIKAFAAKVIRYAYLEQDLTPQALSEIYEETAGHVLKMNLANNSSAATTLTIVAYPVLGRAQIVHVGDSRAYLFSRGTLIRLTEDHKVPGTSVLTRAIGVRVDEPMTRAVDFEPSDSMILVSDGVYNVLRESEMRDFLSKTNNPYVVVREVLGMVEKRRTRDDASIGVITRLF